MSENITHVAIVDDALRLASVGLEAHPALAEALEKHRNLARLGGVTRRGDFHTVALLTRIRDEWDQRQPAQRLAEKCAFVLGWLAHRAADRQMKPLFREVDGDCKLSPKDCSVYQDVFVLKEVLQDGAPYGPFLLKPGAHPASPEKVAELEDLIRTLTQRALIGLHTLIPDDEQIESWLEQLFKRIQPFTVDLKRYAEAYLNPDPELWRRFIEEVHFYDARDHLIQAARTVQRGTRVSRQTVLAAAAQPATSHYAQTLQCAWRYLDAANAFLKGDLDAESLKVTLELFQPGRDGKSV
jgi:hypothetical protein